MSVPLSLITYVAGDMKNDAVSMVDTAFSAGFEWVSVYNPDYICDTDFWYRNIELLNDFDRSDTYFTGYGLWLPYIILERLRQMPSDGVLFYIDSSLCNEPLANIDRIPDQILKLLSRSEKGYIIGSEKAKTPVELYVKKAVFDRLGIKSEDFKAKNILSDKWSVWRPTKQSFDLLEKWLDLCQDAEMLRGNGDGNVDNFRRHMNAQAILSLLVHCDDGNYILFNQKHIIRSFGEKYGRKSAEDYMMAVDQFLLEEPEILSARIAQRNIERNRNDPTYVDMAKFMFAGAQFPEFMGPVKPDHLSQSNDPDHDEI